jgi:hypothetical protein
MSISSSSDQPEPDFSSHQSAQYPTSVITSDKGSAVSSDDEDPSDDEMPPIENSYNNESENLPDDSDERLPTVNSGGTSPLLTNEAEGSYANSVTGEVANNSWPSRISSRRRRIPPDDNDTSCSECGRHIPTEHLVRCDAPLCVEKVSMPFQ